MKEWLFLQPQGRLRDSAALLLYWAVAVGFFWGCNCRVVHHGSPVALAVFAILCGLFLAYGRFFVLLTPVAFQARAGLSMRFLCGYLISNTFLFILTLATPFSIVVNVSIVAAGGLAVLLVQPRGGKAAVSSVDPLPDLLCLILSVAAAALWCGDALHVFARHGTDTVFQLWPDSFFHARQISIFAQSHGLRTISNMQMAGVAAPVYHYASYAFPAAVCALTKTGAYETFASFQLPFGVLLSGLAAFALGTAIWGQWPGLAAAAALLLLPDAYQQGLGNKLLSYNFLQQVGPAGLYGVACITVAWTFILIGCETGTFAALLPGYAIAVLCVAYKAHLFVANAFLVMIYPCIFFKKQAAMWRFLIGIALAGTFVSVAAFSQRFESIPTLRLDGSSVREYANILLGGYEGGALKTFLTGVLDPQQATWRLDLAMAALIVLSTFGVWTVVCPLAAFLARKRTPGAGLFLPLFVVVNYLTMSLGLAMDTRNIAFHEELVHRPFVWAYFVVAAWTGGAVYAFMKGNRPPETRPGRIATAIVALSCLAIPAVLAQNVQTMPAWGHRRASIRKMNHAPTALVKMCVYVRENSKPADIIQDSENDGRLVVTALAERPEFAACLDETLAPPELRRRVDALAAFKQMTTEADLNAFARRNNISFYILEPESKTAWPQSFLDSAVFGSEGYRVFHWPSSPMVSVTR